MTCSHLKCQLGHAILNNDKFRIDLILNNPSLRKCCNNCYVYSPLYLSILAGNREVTQKLIESGIGDINEVTYLSPLELSMKIYDLDTALLLVSKHVNSVKAGTSTLGLARNCGGRLKALIIYKYILDQYLPVISGSLPTYLHDGIVLCILSYL